MNKTGLFLCLSALFLGSCSGNSLASFSSILIPSKEYGMVSSFAELGKAMDYEIFILEAGEEAMSLFHLVDSFAARAKQNIEESICRFTYASCLAQNHIEMYDAGNLDSGELRKAFCYDDARESFSFDLDSRTYKRYASSEEEAMKLLRYCGELSKTNHADPEVELRGEQSYLKPAYDSIKDSFDMNQVISSGNYGTERFSAYQFKGGRA